MLDSVSSVTTTSICRVDIMSLEVIYVTRHGFRSNWAVNHSTGEYTSHLVSPTGIAADPELTSHGVDQSKQLAVRLLEVDPPIERVYSSPFYRCLQTIEPFVSQRSNLVGKSGHKGKDLMIRAEPGVGEWFGSAPFEHPTSAAIEVLKPMFPAIDISYEPIIRPTRTGESLAELHDRVAATMQEIISQCDRDGIRAIVICTHAAVVIALGRVLTGAMPDSVDVEDFSAFTCGLSTYRRRTTGESFAADSNNNKRNSGELGAAREPAEANSLQASTTTPQAASLTLPSGQGGGVAVRAWKGCGVTGGWDCTSNSDCSHLAAGEERGWRFSGDEAFDGSVEKSYDAGIGLGVVVEGKGTKGSRPTGTNSRL